MITDKWMEAAHEVSRVASEFSNSNLPMRLVIDGKVIPFRLESVKAVKLGEGDWVLDLHVAGPENKEKEKSNEY